MISKATIQLLLSAAKRAHAAEVSVTLQQERELRHGLAAMLKTAIERAESELATTEESR